MDNKDPLNLDIDNLLNSIPGDSQNINVQSGDHININVDDVLKITEEYVDVDSGISNRLDFLNSTQKNLKELENIDSSIKDTEINNLLNTEIPSFAQSKKKKKIEIPKFNNSIEFIDYMENKYIESTIKKKKNLFKLKNYESELNKKPTILQFPNKQNLTEKIFREKTPINSITAKKHLIFTGDTMGKIKMFSCEKECEIKSFIYKDLNCKVLCMDISDDMTTLIAGYNNGYIILWDLKFGKVKKVLKDEHDNGILCAKFIKCEESITEFISSDCNGYVNKLILSQNFLYLNVTNVNIIYYKLTPFYQIDILKFNNEEKNYECFKKINPEIIALACTEIILIYQLNPKPKQLYKIHRPLYFSKSYIPDISFGFGYIPRNTPLSILGNLNEEELKELNPIAQQNNIDIGNQNRLFSVSWEKIIYIYVVKIDKNTGFQNLILVGHYVNTSQILRMGFISDSILFSYDNMYKSFKVLNTGLMTPGDITLTEDHNIIPQLNKKHKPELNDIKMDDQFLFQSIIKDLSEKKRDIKLPTYNNFIINQWKTLYILTKKNFSFGKLLNWEQCINNLKQEGEWMEALTLGLDIYLGKNISFPDIPIDENGRKMKVGSALKGMILHYCIINIENSDLDNCLDICIEFCILIDDIDYLINKVKPIFDNKGYSEDFIEKLEPFILNDNMKNQNIGYDALLKIVDFYIQKNDIETLSLIFIHLNLSSFYSEDIINICVQYKLITSLIDIYMNNKEENYFEPILKIYDMFVDSKEIEYDKFISYEEALNNNSLFDIINSKQYIGDKLLWYINLLIDGIKYPKKDNIPDDKHISLVKDTFIWMIKKNILIELINFDSLSVFTILTKLFTTDKLYDCISKIEFDAQKFEGIIYKSEQINESKIQILLKVIFDVTQNLNDNFSIKLDLYTFVLKIYNQTEIENDIVIQTITFFLNIECQLNIYKDEIDIFGFRNKNYPKEKLIQLSKDINDLLNNPKLKLKEEEYKSLLKETDKTSFILVKINLLKILNENIECLNIFLKEYKFNDRKEKIFEFIDEILLKYKKHNLEQFEKFKEECMKKIIDLCIISSQYLYELIYKWYDNNQTMILDKLKVNKNLQLDYLEKVLAGYKEDNLPIDDDEIGIYTNLLNLHIDLLCECGKKEEILPNLKKRISYPPECLDKFIKYEVYDACIYFYILQNNLEEALTLSNNLLSEGIQHLIKDLRENQGNDFDKLSSKHEENLERSINICQQDYINDETQEKSFLKVLKVLYNFRREVKFNTTKRTEVNTLIDNNIQNVFESMHTYVKITKIMTTLTNEIQEIEYKEFKPILIKMLNGFIQSRNILELASNIFTVKILKDENEYNKISKNGNIYKMEKCDFCSNNFKEDDVVCFFKCNHKIHFMCSFKENDFFACSVCRKNEVENAITSYFDEENTISKPNENEMEEYINNIKNSDYELKSKYHKLSTLNKQLLFDNAEIFNV